MSLVTAFLAPLMRTSPRSGPVGSIVQAGVVVVGDGVGGVVVTRQSCHRVGGGLSASPWPASPGWMRSGRVGRQERLPRTERMSRSLSGEVAKQTI